ncbi:hypothetical protein WOLCODRAFT_140402 [Wolfiporia cocos MD-104 SS10]|uniref:TPR-like protein n=1 Tax=Wolfiporia cocos (strain MD-104) TaxID=742152 RepID=A0A2H3J2D1_WOLCO|nr:hypothetical protein WOLCODRAFT_140402 [Wolfiporia cocos MD-104 SS10]
MAASNLVGAYHNSPEALTVQGLVLFLIADSSQALYSAQLALKIDPGFVPAQRLHQRIECVQQLQCEGNLACHNQHWGYALRMYEEALEHIGNHEEEAKGGRIRAIFLSLRAHALVKLDHFQEALYDIDESARLYPGCPEAYALCESILCTPAGLADFDTVRISLEANGAAPQMFPLDIDYDARGMSSSIFRCITEAANAVQIRSTLRISNPTSSFKGCKYSSHEAL